MKPLAASDSNGVPSQQDKTPVSSPSTRNIFSPSFFFLSLSPHLWPTRYDYRLYNGCASDFHRASTRWMNTGQIEEETETRTGWSPRRASDVCQCVVLETAAMCSLSLTRRHTYSLAKWLMVPGAWHQPAERPDLKTYYCFSWRPWYVIVM